MLDYKTSKSNPEVSKSKYFFLENYVTSEGAVSHNVTILSTSPHYSLPSKVSC